MSNLKEEEEKRKEEIQSAIQDIAKRVIHSCSVLDLREAIVSICKLHDIDLDLPKPKVITEQDSIASKDCGAGFRELPTTNVY